MKQIPYSLADSFVVSLHTAARSAHAIIICSESDRIGDDPLHWEPGRGFRRRSWCSLRFEELTLIVAKFGSVICLYTQVYSHDVLDVTTV